MMYASPHHTASEHVKIPDASNPAMISTWSAAGIRVAGMGPPTYGLAESRMRARRMLACRLSACVLALSAGAACSADPGNDGDVEAAVADVRCSERVVRLLEDLDATTGVLPAPPTAAGGRVLRFRSSELGRWVVVTQEPTGRLVARERSPTGGRTWMFDEDCSVVESSPESAIGPTDSTIGFRDQDLAAAISEAAPDPVVVYLWSPHMPLAVDGVAEVLEAGEQTGARVEIVLIDHADMDFARREVERVGLPENAMRVAASVELLMRDGQLHAPSMLIFSVDRVSPVMPGYRNAEGYARFIEAFRLPNRRP